MRMYAPSPTVNASRVPLYMQGLGDDLLPPDLGSPSFSADPGIFAPTDPVLQPLIDSGLSHDAASLVADAASSGAITDAQFQQIVSGQMSATQIENLILGAGRFASVGSRPPSSASAAVQAISAARDTVNRVLGPSPSPRVNTRPQSSPFTGNTAIAGMVIPNLALFGIGTVILLGVTKR